MIADDHVAGLMRDDVVHERRGCSRDPPNEARFDAAAATDPASLLLASHEHQWTDAAGALRGGHDAFLKALRACPQVTVHAILESVRPERSAAESNC